MKCWFLKRGENRSTRRKTSRSRVENQQTQPTYDAEYGNRIEPGTHWWKASALTTAPTLLPCEAPKTGNIVGKLANICLKSQMLRGGGREMGILGFD